MRIGDDKPTPPPTVKTEPARYRSPAEDLYDCIAAEVGAAPLATRFSLVDALDQHRPFLQLPGDVRRMFEHVAEEFIG